MKKQITPTLSLEALGFTKEELQNRVIERLCSNVLHGKGYDEEGNEFDQESAFARKLEQKVKEQIDVTINTLAQKHVLPNVHAYLENLCLQKTNEWGEKAAKKVTFVEYLTQRAEAYMMEMVNYEGKPKGTDSYSWTGTQTRITHLVHQHLHYSIEQAMKNALAVANSSISTGIQETVKKKLAEISVALTVKTEARS